MPYFEFLVFNVWHSSSVQDSKSISEPRLIARGVTVDRAILDAFLNSRCAVVGEVAGEDERPNTSSYVSFSVPTVSSAFSEKMKVIVPNRLTYPTLRSLLTDSDVEARDADEVEVDWQGTAWAELPEIVSLINWCSQLTHLGIKVRWLLLDPRKPLDGTDQVRSSAREALGEQRYALIDKQLFDVKRRALRGQFSRKRREELGAVVARAFQGFESAPPSVERWLELESFPLNYMDFLAYLDRYKVFDRAAEAGVTILPDSRELPKSLFAKSPDTACLELRAIQSSVEVDDVVRALHDQQELNRVLGEYAQLDVVRRGALSYILVNELGHNVAEHANASAAWLCTRLVPDRRVSVHSQGDPALASFRARNAGFLEIIACDNGDGLVSGLSPVLDRDEREAVRSKYPRKADGTFQHKDLVDYAFDRLSSRKRDITRLLHMLRDPESDHRVVASGLYWVWNVVRSHKGVLSVRTSDLCAWYDFANESHGDGYERWTVSHPESDPHSIPFCGTMIRICLPLRNFRNAAQGARLRTATTRLGDPENPRLTGEAPAIQTVWVGDIARNVPLSHLKSEGRELNPQQLLPGIEDSHEARVINELQRHHFPLKDGHVLILDLCGMRSTWAKQSAAPLCHFFLEMNYTSTSGRSAVVLWNVPTEAEELFEDGVRLAGSPYSQLKDFRRAALLVFDDGRMRFFCGWEEAEEIFSNLSLEGELDLEIAGRRLSDEDSKRLANLITENSHLFYWLDQTRIRLRAWPVFIRGTAWNQSIRWLNTLLDTNVEASISFPHGHRSGSPGVRRTPKRTYFRLPSMGKLVKEFYQFGVAFADEEACARIAWLLSETIKIIEHERREVARWIVSVTRPTTSLVHYLVNDFLRNGDTQALAASTLDELAAIGRGKDGLAIFITDVISTGTLCDQVARSLPHIEWMGTVAILDTSLSPSERPDAVELSPGLTLYSPRSVSTGRLYSLANRSIEKTESISIPATDIEAIDKVNVAPVMMQDDEKHPDADFNIWPFLERKERALRIGHFRAGDYHHYIYYVNTRQLLDATQSSGQSLRKLIASAAGKDTAGTNSDKIIVMHPPADTSDAEYIATEVQRETGALYRHVLHRENFAGQWRFSPFVDHGLPVAGSTIILIDDGSNTGETLMGLLDAATVEAHQSRPSNVLAYVGITRMPPHKAHVLRNLTRLSGVTGTLKVRFAVGLGIPVFSPRTCPVCKFRDNLGQFKEHSLFSTYADEMIAQTKPLSIRSETTREQGSLAMGRDKLESPPRRDLNDPYQFAAGRSSDPSATAKSDDLHIDASEGGSDDEFLWCKTTEMHLFRLREAIELLDYHTKSSDLLDQILKQAVADSPDPAAGDALLDLGFVLCVEPELSAASVFTPYLKSLRDAAIRQVSVCEDKSLLTFVGLLFHLMTAIHRSYGPSGLEESATEVWSALFSRNRLTTKFLAKVITYTLAEASTERGFEGEPYKSSTCQIWLNALGSVIDSRATERVAFVEAFAPFFIRAGMRAIQGQRSPYPIEISAFDTSDPYELASDTATKFWRHSSEYVKSLVDSLVQGARRTNSPPEDIAPIRSLVLAFDELHRLQYRLGEIESTCRKNQLEKLGALDDWNVPELESAMTRSVRLLAKLVELTEDQETHWDHQEFLTLSEDLTKMWDELRRWLDPAFDIIFPEVEREVAARWNEFSAVTGLAGFVAVPLDAHADPGLSRSRVFIPRPLLWRFMDVAMENIKSAAFNSWSNAEITQAAKARVRISSDRSSGYPMISVQVIDNGERYRKSAPDQGDGRGLKQVEAMAEYYGAIMRFPYIQDHETIVELRMRHRLTENQETHD